jgi:hypothetical protein
VLSDEHPDRADRADAVRHGDDDEFCDIEQAVEQEP